jgi:RHS repeat-associated protein
VLRGWPTNKVYADGNGTKYGYGATAAGRLGTRTWSRGSPQITATYGYTVAGDPATISYNDGVTSGLTNTYDRRGRLATTLQNGITTTFTLNDSSHPLSEGYSGGALNGLSVTNGYDAYQRRSALGAGGYASTVTTYGFDNASRLSSASDGTYSANYSYLANSPLIGEIQYQQSGTPRLTMIKNHDQLNRLASIANTPAGTGQAPVSFAYFYSAANQRMQATLADSSRWNFGFDPLGQLMSGRRSWADGTLVAGEQFQYTFDTIGNRTSTATGGDQFGGSLRPASYAANNLNEYTSRTVPGAFDVAGVATANALVNVNGQMASRKGEFFHATVSVSNSGAPVFQSVTEAATAAVGQSATTNSGNYFVPKTPESYSCDLDGNLLSDGHWTYTWDAENRLIQMVANTALPSSARYSLSFTYDAQGRRIQKAVSLWNGSSYVLQYTRRFLYDGWNLVAELDGSNTLVRSYIWGLDVSGSLQGAGGVGGLLVVKPASGNPLFVGYDGNGNVAGLVDGTSGVTTAQYAYGPFGEVIELIPGTSGNPCPFRFSTKYDDDETDLLYYGYRFYNPNTGHWLNRDPFWEISYRSFIGNTEKTPELGNLYVMVLNDPVGKIDTFGLTSTSTGCRICRESGIIGALGGHA